MNLKKYKVTINWVSHPIQTKIVLAINDTMAKFKAVEESGKDSSELYSNYKTKAVQVSEV